MLEGHAAALSAVVAAGDISPMCHAVMRSQEMSCLLCCGQQLSESRRETGRQWRRRTRTIRRWRRRSVGLDRVLQEFPKGCRESGAAAEAGFCEAPKSCTVV